MNFGGEEGAGCKGRGGEDAPEKIGGRGKGRGKGMRMRMMVVARRWFEQDLEGYKVLVCGDIDSLPCRARTPGCDFASIRIIVALSLPADFFAAADYFYAR